MNITLKKLSALLVFQLLFVVAGQAAGDSTEVAPDKKIDFNKEPTPDDTWLDIYDEFIWLPLSLEPASPEVTGTLSPDGTLCLSYRTPGPLSRLCLYGLGGLFVEYALGGGNPLSLPLGPLPPGRYVAVVRTEGDARYVGRFLVE